MNYAYGLCVQFLALGIILYTAIYDRDVDLYD